jgi:signal transduction histidine kinase
MKPSHPQAVAAAGLLEELRRPAAPPAARKQPETSPALPAGAKPADILLERCFRELIRYYRHSGVGRLCRGLVHRMNSPLQVLFFQLELLEQKSLEELSLLPGIPHPAAERLQALQRYRMKKIRQVRRELENLQSLSLTLTRHGAHEDAEDRLPLDLNELCRQELDLYQANPFFKHQVEKEFSFQEGLPAICGHYIDFSQSFRNLLDNALEAMHGAARRSLTVTTALADGRLLLQLGDTGPGIAPAILPRIFEPFFTTKTNGPTGHAGLGLFLARRLLAPYGGEIRVQSLPGETWVTMALPVK